MYLILFRQLTKCLNGFSTLLMPSVNFNQTVEVIPRFSLFLTQILGLNSLPQPNSTLALEGQIFPVGWLQYYSQVNNHAMSLTGCCTLFNWKVKDFTSFGVKLIPVIGYNLSHYPSTFLCLLLCLVFTNQKLFDNRKLQLVLFTLSIYTEIWNKYKYKLCWNA